MVPLAYTAIHVSYATFYTKLLSMLLPVTTMQSCLGVLTSSLCQCSILEHPMVTVI